MLQNGSAWVISPWVISTKFAEFVGAFMLGYMLKFGGFAQGVTELQGFKFMGFISLFICFFVCRTFERQSL